MHHNDNARHDDDNLIIVKDIRAESEKPHEAPSHEDVESWYDRWRGRIHAWVEANTHRALANLLVLIPDFLALLVGLVGDARVPRGLKTQIALALAYVIAPVDLMPEAVLGVLGLADDATVMVVLIASIRRFASIDPAILRAHWRGQQNFDELMDEAEALIEDDGDELLQNGLLGVIKKRFGRPPTA